MNNTRVAVMGIIVEDRKSVSRLNELLSDYSPIIIGRMGLPYKERGINIISVALDGPQEEISALSGKIGQLEGISVKTAYAKLDREEKVL